MKPPSYLWWHGRFSSGGHVSEQGATRSTLSPTRSWIDSSDRDVRAEHCAVSAETSADGVQLRNELLTV